jgi:uncharacterized membrane protein YeaQ/YmgE (transglycosylase-associated protein family)
MSFLGFLLLGLIAGAIAKFIMPGKSSGGWFTTLVLGVVGAMLGGWLGSLTTWALAIGGSVLVLILFGVFSGRSSK